MSMSPPELAALRDRVSRERLEPQPEPLSPKAEAGRQALAALHEAERRYRERNGAEVKAPRLKLVCAYCGVPVRLRDQSKRKPVPPATCILHRDLPALDPNYGGGCGE